MDIEYEATFSNIDKDELRTKLKELGARLVKSTFMMKRVTFNLPVKEEKKWLRVRDEGDKITMSFKCISGSGETIEGQKEVCLNIDDFSFAEKFLENIGCEKKAYQENYREIWELDNVEIAIDEWPFLEPFVEIEGKNEAEVKAVAEKLGFDYSKAIFNSTDEQYSRKYNVSSDYVVNEIKRLAFEDENPFEK